MNTAWLASLGSIVLLAILVALLAGISLRPTRRASEPLLVYCAAGVKAPVENLARAYEKIFHTPIQLSYGGSQTLLASIELSRRGDLYLPADDSYIQLARAKGLAAESLPLARMTAVLAVRRGNPKNISSLDDLWRGDVTLAQANPDAAAIGKITREVFQKTGQWEELKKRTTVFKPTVNDVANDLKLGAVDAGFMWDATVKQYPELEAVRVPALSNAVAQISVAVLRTSTQPAAALRFARFVAGPENGQPEWRRSGFATGAEFPQAPSIPRNQ